MAVSVIANLMPRSLNGASNLRALANVFANQEKRGFGLMAGQHVQEAERVRIIGAVIEGERKLAGVGAMRERAAVKLRSRCHGGVSGVSGRSGGSESCKSEEHSFQTEDFQIVNFKFEI